MEKQIDSIPTAAMKKLAAWHWPGNIRELENFIERSVILTHRHSPVLQLPLGEIGTNGKTPPVIGSREVHDRDEITRILKETNGRVAVPQGAAVRMGIKRTTLISRMKKLRMSHAASPSADVFPSGGLGLTGSPLVNCRSQLSK